MFLIPLKSIKNIADILAKCTKTIKREIKRGTLRTCTNKLDTKM